MLSIGRDVVDGMGGREVLGLGGIDGFGGAVPPFVGVSTWLLSQ